MAALVLSLAGSSLGGVFGPAGALAGRLIGAVAGNFIDHALFGGTVQRHQQGPRLADLDIMASTEGAPIPRVYGRARLSGQMIWATRLQEVVTSRTETSGGGGGKGGGQTVSTTTTTYSYYANFAVGLCEGPIAAIKRIWADGKPLDTAHLTLRLHCGDESQEPDPLIVAKQGAAGAPAYRGLAHVVFERLPLEQFGNRIPQLSFEIVRPVGALETMVRAVALIPGATEFGYEPANVVRQGAPGRSLPENGHVSYAVSDIEASLDELQAVCPNLERVAVVVAWFGDDLRAGVCRVRPGIDNRSKATFGATWSVAGIARADAYLVSQIDGRAAYGGTPSDGSVIHLIQNLKARGLKVTLYPFVMLDIAAGNTLPDPWTGASGQPAYPWRGRITCDPAPGRPGSVDGTAAAATQIGAFFAGSDGYRAMVLHYAGLAEAAGGVDGFVIGSEMIGMTRIRAASGVYPAVDALVTLAADVRAVLGSGTLLTYAADWTEYGAHVVDGIDGMASEVRFPLDPLWASAAIDAVGIDYYPPLSDWRDNAEHLDRALASSIYDRAYLAGRLRGGEAYEWFYADNAARLAQARTPISDGFGKPWTFRQKDIWNWWASPHVERVGGVELGAPTAWVPQGKPIWLTECGCPAVDKGANQPSVFPDAKSAESGLPYFSRGSRDDLIQRRLLEAVLGSFDPAFGASGEVNPVSIVYGGRMVAPDAIHLWCWDARPYPVFPAAGDIWSDGGNWVTGHWLTGRLGFAPLDALVGALLADAGIEGVETGALGGGPEGYVIDRPMSPRAALEPLMLAYGFTAREEQGVLQFRPRGGAPALDLTEDDLVIGEAGAPARLTRAQETDLPREVTLGFSDSGADYRRATARSRRLVGGAARVQHADLAMISDDGAAVRCAEIVLQDLWAGRESAAFALPPNRIALAPGDVIGLTVNDRRRLYEISEITDAQARGIKARSIDPEIFGLPLPPPTRRAPALPPAIGPVHALLLDLPTLAASEPPVLTRLAVFADPWPGAVAAWRSDDGTGFAPVAIARAPSIMGETLDDLPRGPSSRFDHAHACRVRLYGGALAALSDGPLLAGGNVAAVRGPDGAWEVLQFGLAELTDARTYRLSRLLRGQAGSEPAIADLLPAGAPFVLLDPHVVPVARGLDMLDRTFALRIVAAGRDHAEPSSVAMSLTPGATALRPLAPVQVRGRRIAAGVTISFVRRTRRDGDSWGAGDVPLGEDREAYEIDILDGALVRRTLGVAGPGALYAAADEIADFGAPQASLTVRVVQLSATVGRGFAATATLNL